MKKPLLALLALLSPGDLSMYAHLPKLCKILGVDIEFTVIPEQNDAGWKTAWQCVRRLLSEADAFVLSDYVVVREFGSQIHDRISAGARVFVTPDVNDLEGWNKFLHPYGIQATTIRVHADGPDSREVQIPNVPEYFLDENLLQDVDAFQTDGLWGLTYGGPAIPVMLAPEGTWAVDSKTDFPPRIPWSRKSMPTIARWEEKGAVVVSMDSFLVDHANRWTNGALMPGIQENEQLASNLIRYLTASGSSEPTYAQECNRAEKNLCDFVTAILKSTFGEDHWWVEAVPLPIRKLCVANREEEKQKFPPECYLTIINLKTIMESNWKLFMPHFVDAGSSSGKENALRWLDRFNEVRKMVAHPLKAYMAAYKLSEAELASVKDADLLCLRLLQSLSPA
jgi:hypothetical protein